MSNEAYRNLAAGLAVFTAVLAGFALLKSGGRTDDPKAGWKGRGIWTISGERTPWHLGRR